MLIPVRSSQFKRDVKRIQKRDKDMIKLRALIRLLIEQAPLPEHYQDHPLRGNWHGYRDAYIEPDWLLLYRVANCIAWRITNFSWRVPAVMPICFESKGRNPASYTAASLNHFFTL